MIERAEHVDGFTVIQNEALRDDRLSIEARGLLAFMLTMADGWDFSIKGLAALTGLKECATMRLTKELKTAGYLEQKSRRDARGVITGWAWIVHEVPTLQKTQSVENPDCGKSRVWKTQTVAQPDCGKSAVIRNNKDKEIPNRRNNKDKEKTRRFTPPTVEEVRAYCQERGNSIDPEAFVDFYKAKGWKIGKDAMKDWKAAVRTWEKRETKKAKTEPISQESSLDRLTRLAIERAEGRNA